MSKEYSEEDLATLTPEERAVILDDGLSEDDQKLLSSIANGDDDENEEDDVDDADHTQNDDAQPVEASAKVDNEGEKKSDVEQEKPERFRTHYQADVPVDFPVKIEQISARMDDLTAKFKAGEIEFDEFQAGSRAADIERTELIKAQTKAEIAAEMTQQSAQQEWAFLVKSFVKSVAKEGGTDYIKDEVKRNDLDGFIKVLATNPSNNDKDPEWFLEEAHKRVNALYGIGETKKQTASTESKPVRKPHLDNLPKNLSNVPGSDGPGDLNDEFSAIDALTGDKLEAAIARMTPAQREKFMSQA